jgi:hypothetical protein
MVVEGSVVGIRVDEIEFARAVVMGNVEQEVVLIGEFLGAIWAGVIHGLSSDGVLWHGLAGAEAMGDVVAKLVSVDEVLVIVFLGVELVWALGGKGAGVQLALWVR